jgi:orotate phosphoribosyltransferase
MPKAELLHIFEEAGAVQHGHFVLSSGLHSDTYVQCALVLQYPDKAEQLGQALASQLHRAGAACVVSPALGGLIIGHEVGRALGVRAIFTERDASGQMTLRRGFTVSPGERVVVVEDVWTTGGSTQETIGVIAEAGGRVVATGALLDRSNGRLNLSVPAEALLTLPIASYQPDDCPLCRSGSEAVRPGSRYSRAER